MEHAALPRLILIELNGVLVYRPWPGELQGMIACCDVRDGSSGRYPVFVRPGAVEFLKALHADIRCVVGVVTTWNCQTCEPILEYLRQETGIEENNLLCFDATSMRDHEDGLMHLDGRPQGQHDLFRLCEECCTARGCMVDMDQSFFVISRQELRRDQRHRVLRLPPFDRDCVLHMKRGAQALKELQKAQSDVHIRADLPSEIERLDREPETVEHKHQIADPWSAGNVAGEYLPLVIVDLNCLLVYRSEVGRIGGISHQGLDGTNAKRPFYANPGAVEFLRALYSGRHCIPAVMTSMQAKSCEPIVAWLRSESGQNQLHCFDVQSMVPHEENSTFPDGRPRFQRDIVRMCIEYAAQGQALDEVRSILVVSDIRSVRKEQAPRAVVLSPFAADDVSNPLRQSMVVDELRQASLIIANALSLPALPDAFPVVPIARHVRPVEVQHAMPPPPRGSRDLLATGWQPQGQWVCADSVTADGNCVCSQSKSGWRGARHTEPVGRGTRRETAVKILSGRTVRVGWSARGASEVGVDQWGWGYGGTANRSHKGKFTPYGEKYGIGDVVTSVLDRTSNIASMTFLLNGKQVAQEPAFSVSEEQLEGPLYFALCGTADFKVELIAEEQPNDNATAPITAASELEARARQAEEDPEQTKYGRRVLVLCFSRHPSDLDVVLLGSDLARPATKRGTTIQPLWANGAKIFVERLTLADVEESRVFTDLCPRHVVVYEDEEHLVDEALQAMSCKTRPRLKANTPKATIPSSGNCSRFECSLRSVSEASEAVVPSIGNPSSFECSVASEVSDDSMGDFVYSVMGTFIHFAKAPDARSRRAKSCPP